MKLKFTRNNIRLALTAASIGALFGAQALAAEAGNAAAATPVFAQVGDVVVTQREFDNAFYMASRSKFYHGKPPEAEVAALQREVGDRLIASALLLTEARRLKLKPDADAIKRQVEQYEQRNADNEQWQKMKERALPVLVKRLEDENLRAKLEKQVRQIPAPKEKQVRKYYTAHPDKFTEPEQLRVSVILLKVDPSSPAETWKAAREFGLGLVKQLHEGANFAELATKYSGDEATAPQGGDMGYLHGGMMSGLPAEIVKNLKPGEISDAVNLMEGVAILKLTERNEAKLSSFDRVKERARTLYMEEESSRAWENFIAKLRKKIPVKVDESHYTPLALPAAN